MTSLVENTVRARDVVPGDYFLGCHIPIKLVTRRPSHTFIMFEDGLSEFIKPNTKLVVLRKENA